MTKSISFPAIKVSQPIGEFYTATISHENINKIAYVDRRSISNADKYFGIQRQLNKKRVEEIRRYVNTSDATFPTAIVIAVPAVCAKYDKKNKIMTLSEFVPKSNKAVPIPFEEIAKVLDGQHRLAGLEQYDKGIFELNVTIFIEADIADQAMIFATVNLAQTKVNKSLAYDLFDLAIARSPQKTCHNIAVALDRLSNSPFYEKIKRLGVNTRGRFDETITQATFVESLLSYISDDPVDDRDRLKLKKKIVKVQEPELNRLIFRNMFIDEMEMEIADIILFFFESVRMRWPKAWSSRETGYMLNKTNGFKGFMRFLRPCYIQVVQKIGEIPSAEKFSAVMQKIELKDNDFTTEKFQPGASGELRLYKELLSLSNLSG